MMRLLAAGFCLAAQTALAAAPRDIAPDKLPRERPIGLRASERVPDRPTDVIGLSPEMGDFELQPGINASLEPATGPFEPATARPRERARAVDAIVERIHIPEPHPSDPARAIDQARRNLNELRAQIKALRDSELEPPVIAVNLGMDPNRYHSKLSYARAVVEAGGLPLLVPPSPPELLRRYAAMAHGFLFTGGPDIPASYYGQEPHPLSNPLSEEKAESDSRFMKLALHSGKPLFAICLGEQWLNVRLGGKLLQWLANVDKHYGFGRKVQHPVQAVPDTRLAEIVGTDPFDARSSHRQAADPEHLGDGLRVAAWAADGTVEALELVNANGRFVVGVQWHPERTPDSPQSRALFSAFVGEAAKLSERIRRVRTLFISDMHLGNGSWTGELLEFLRRHEAETIYLVGDIVDLWKMKKWTSADKAVLRELRQKQLAGARLVYVPGNHDRPMRKFIEDGRTVLGVPILRDTEHTTADGRRLLITHGDESDYYVKASAKHASAGLWVYRAALWLNRNLNLLRLRLGLPYYPLTVRLKTRLKQARSYIQTYEQWIAENAHARGFDGVVNGHIHWAANRTIEIAGKTIHYVNTGDWTESLTAAVENFDGRIELVRWSNAKQK